MWFMQRIEIVTIYHNSLHGHIKLTPALCRQKEINLSK